MGEAYRATDKTSMHVAIKVLQAFALMKTSGTFRAQGETLAS